MDDALSNSTYSLNEAILHLNLAGKSNVGLSVGYWNLKDERHALPARFSGHANGDGIAISPDGQTWYAVPNVNFSGAGTLRLDLDSLIRQFGLSYTSDFQIKFQQYDNEAGGRDGLEWDNIRVESLTSDLVGANAAERTLQQSLSPSDPASQPWERAVDQVFGTRGILS